MLKYSQNPSTTKKKSDTREVFPFFVVVFSGWCTDNNTITHEQ